MYVEVDLTADPTEVALREPDDFGSLKVVVHHSGAGPSALYAALDGIGWLDDRGNAILHAAALKNMAGARVRNRDWLRSFEGMVDYAAERGWTAVGGTALHAHCEWLGR
jgi:hypothetical protein